MTSRNWFATNHILDEKISSEKDLPMDKIKYLVGQLEVGEKSGKHHYQFYFVLHKPQRLSYVKKIFPGAHLERRKGSHSKAKIYCTKEFTKTGFKTRIEGPWEHGSEPPGSGKRTDLVTIKTAIDDGASSADIANDYFGTWVRYNKSFEKYIEIRRPARVEMTKGIFYHGSAGIGKSYLVKEKFPDAEYIMYDGKYFSDYSGGETVVFDDCSLNLFKRHTLLQLVNHTPYKLRCMGKYVQFNAKSVIFISNYLDQRFINDDAIARRYDVINLGCARLY